MAYKISKGSTIQGDIKGEDDTDRDTIIDFGEDRIDLQTNGTTRLKISGSQGQVTLNEAYTFPYTDGNRDQVLATDGGGAVSWVDPGGAGSSIDILKIALASETNFTWNGSSGDFHKVPFTRNLIDTFSGTPFNTSTNVFTAPSNGVYEFSVQLTFNNIQDDTTQYQAWLMTSVSSNDTYTISGMYGAALTQFDPPVSNAINRLDLFTVLDMSANQTITVYVRQNGGTQNNCHLLSWPMQTSLVIKKLL